MNGAEYDDVMAEIAPYTDKFEVMAVGKALLTSHEDYEAVIEALLADNENAGSADTALVYMGHGTHHFANATYSQLEAMMHAEGYENAFVGTVEGFPTLEVVQSQVTAYGAKKIVLMPLMVVAGDHASNDMAGDEEDSWKVILTDAGFEVECVLEGLGQNAGIRAINIDHIKAAIAEAGLKSPNGEGTVHGQSLSCLEEILYETNQMAVHAFLYVADDSGCRSGGKGRFSR